jgi:phosphatidylglycerophosphate synthase
MGNGRRARGGAGAHWTVVLGAGLGGQVLLLMGLAAGIGMGMAGWVVGLGCALVADGLLTRALVRTGTSAVFGPASWVTLTRTSLAVGLAALVAGALGGRAHVSLLVWLAATALALDLADGQLARRTRSVTSFGGRFDGEADAFLLLVLSLYVSTSFGSWVLLIGAARYLYLACERKLAWMRVALPTRRWRKLVAAMQGVVLALAAANALPFAQMRLLLVCSLAALSVSFGECVWWLWRRRHAAPVPPQLERGPVRRLTSIALTGLAFALVWLALVAPDRPVDLTPGAVAKLPFELVVLAGTGALVPTRLRRVLAVLVGTLLAALIVVRILDMGFYTLFDRPFLPIDDLSQWSNGIETLRDSIGQSTANLLVDFVTVFVAALVAVCVWGLVRVTDAAAAYRRHTLASVAVLAVLWGALRIGGTPIATTDASALAWREVGAVRSGLEAPAALAREISRDRYRSTPGSRLLTGLRGKDVLLLFVESYGQVAVQGTSFSPGVDAVLAAGNAQLKAAGYSARSGWLVSPTFGGISWLAHSTLQSGVRISTQREYDQLVTTHRFTLSQAFGRAGWRTVDVVPSDNRDWKPGKAYYHYDRVYDSRNLGYRGPRFGYATMPDQYTLATLHRLELAAPQRQRVFAEVDMLSSHTPWTVIPRLEPWSEVGHGSLFHNVSPARSASQLTLLQHPQLSRDAYGVSIQYSLRTIFSYLQQYGSGNTVVIMLGDHQPHTIITGPGASHEVPIAIIAKDPAVLREFDSWGWQAGLHPTGKAPVWPMERFRDRFLAATGPQPARS